MKHGAAKAMGAAGLILGLAWPPTQASPQDVAIQTFQFDPARIEVTAGTAVAFINRDDIAHTVTSGSPEGRDGRFDRELAGKDAVATVRLDSPGVYPYFCDRHRSMRGEIRVR